MANQVGDTSQGQPNPGTNSQEAGSRAEQARGIVRRNGYWALGLGLIPFPILDIVALTGVQVKMLKELSDLYKVDFSEDKAKTILGSLITGLGSVGIAGVIAHSLFRVVPVVGQLVGLVGGSVVGGALTVAFGNLFAMHYESGGTLLDFDPEKMRAHFRQEFEKAKDTVKQIKMEQKAGDATPVAP